MPEVVEPDVRARKVAALWNEEDAFTRVRLLLAFARFEPTLATPERRDQ
jgi:hypothetical protein